MSLAFVAEVLVACCVQRFCHLASMGSQAFALAGEALELVLSAAANPRRGRAAVRTLFTRLRSIAIVEPCECAAVVKAQINALLACHFDCTASVPTTKKNSKIAYCDIG